MVCHRCILSVEGILRQESIPFRKVIFGEIELVADLTPEQKDRLEAQLEQVGFELIDNRSSALIEKLKQLIIKRARNEAGETDNKLKLSAYLSRKVNHEYTYLSSLFSSVEGEPSKIILLNSVLKKPRSC